MDENESCCSGCSQEEGEDEAASLRAEGDAEVPPHQGQPKQTDLSFTNQDVTNISQTKRIHNQMPSS